MPGSLFVVEGAPGTGKSSLLRAWRHYAVSRNFAYIDLTPDVLTSQRRIAEDLLAAISNSSGGHGSERSYEDTTQRSTGWGFSKGVRRHRTKVSSTRRESRTTERPSLIGTLREVAVAAAISGRRGVLITIDEATSIERHVRDRDSVAYSEFTTIVQVLNDKLIDHQLPMQAVIAGVVGSKSMIAEASVGRLDPERSITLQPIKQVAIEAIIHDHLDVTDADGRRPATVSAEIIEQHAAAAEGHVLFGTFVGQALQDAAYQALDLGRTTVEDDDLVNASKWIDDNRNETYLRLLGGGVEQTRNVVEHVALAMRLQDGRLTPEQTNAVIAAACGNADEATVVSWRRYLIRHGIIDPLDPLQHYVGHTTQKSDEQYDRLATPSLSQRVAEILGGRYSQIADTVAGVISAHPKQIPEWNWGGDPRIYRVEPLPKNVEARVAI